MKPLFLAAASSVALLGLAACTPSGPPKARAALDCPQNQGDLTRTGQAADGKSCTYRTSDGSDVTLQLVATNGDPRAALAALETSLNGPEQELVKGETDKAAKDVEAAKGEVVKAETAVAAAQASSDAAAKVAEQAKADAASAPGGDASDDADVNLPGLHIQAHDGNGAKGDKAHIDLPSIHIDADDDTDQAQVKVGGVTIDAHDNSVTFRVYRDVRLRGEAFSRLKRGLRASYIYTGKGLPGGQRLVGYEAAGPKAGPITVAIVRSNVDSDEVDMHGHAMRDIKRLVRRNSGT